MTRTKPFVYPLLTGIAGGGLAWCGTEWILHYSGSLGDFRTFSLVLGALAGLLLGLIAPAAEGLRQHQKNKLRDSVIVGGIIGAVAGAGGMLLGQFLMGLLSHSMGGLTGWSGTLARMPGWVIMGMAVGAASGIRSGSFRRIGAALAGGLIGGLAGGAAAELLGRWSGSFVGRGVGMILWGALVALLADLMEARRARGYLTVLSGPLKGRTFPVNQNRMTIAGGGRADLTIPGTSGTEDFGVTRVSVKNGTVLIEAPEAGGVKVNGETVDRTELRYDDVIRVGGATIIYEAGK